jgi:pyridoxal 5'-phosphate synthase pdxS subunit
MSSEPTVVPSNLSAPNGVNGNGNSNGSSTPALVQRGTSGGAGGTFGVKTGLAQMLKGG